MELVISPAYYAGSTEWNAKHREAVQASAETNERSAHDCQHGFLYRIEEMRYSERVAIHLVAYAIHYATPEGHVLWDWSGARRRFVNATARKLYAYTTVDDALESFVRRKQRQIKILSAQLRRAEKALALAGGEAVSALDVLEFGDG